MSLSNSKKNAISSYLNTIVAAVAGLVVNPLLIAFLGPTQFGAWKAIQRLLDVGSAANGGAVQSLKWVIAYRSNKATDEEKRRDVGAALRVLIRWLPAMFLVSAVIVVFLPRFVANVNDARMLYITGGILAVNVVLMSLAAVPDSVLFGSNQGFRSTRVSTAVLVWTNTGMVGAAFLGLGPPGMAVIVVVGTLINGLVTFRVCRKRVSWWGIARPDHKDAQRMNTFSGWTFAWVIANRLINATDVIVISAIAGAVAVSSYTFTSYVVFFALTICQLTTHAITPKLGSFVGSGEWDRARTVAREARELTLALTTGIGSLVVLFNESFVTLWAGQEQFLGQKINILMVLAFMQLAILRTESGIQDTGLEIRAKVTLGMTFTILSIASGAIALSLSGSIAHMFVAIIVARLIGTITFPILANKVVHSASWPIRRLGVGLAILALSAYAATIIHPGNLAEFAVSVAAAALVIGPLVAFTLLSSPTRRKLLDRKPRPL